MKKDFLSIDTLTVKDIEKIFTLTEELKHKGKGAGFSLRGKSIALIFHKPSMRTRVSFEVGMYQLSGNSVYLGPEEIGLVPSLKRYRKDYPLGLGHREALEDISRVLSRYVDGLVVRTFSHDAIVKLAEFASIPVINGLTDLEHPCQALSDLYTIKEKFGRLKGLTLGYIGDGNNVCNSLIQGCVKLNVRLQVATPKGYEPKAMRNANIILTHQPEEAARDADVLYTDVWASMGQEKEAATRRRIFDGYRIDDGLLKIAKRNCLVMHCLPAHRGEEITDKIIEGKNSIIFEQAENRLHSAKAILLRLLWQKK